MDDKTREQQEFFFNRLEKNYRRLKKWARKKNIGSFRAYDRDIPEIPLALDVYDVQPAGSGNAGAETGEGAG
ncbi:MAG: hypothetical protein Pg6C_03380 [Treponemataceae bacterium]|nr:MAG: hypothetical protein Pg6C_03380 [Treponemataceae bacterium]